jgi:hypothetical protein
MDLKGPNRKLGRTHRPIHRSALDQARQLLGSFGVAEREGNALGQPEKPQGQARTPANLKPEQFNAYPVQARKLVISYLPSLKMLPLSFLPSILREISAYDWKFPAEREEIEKQLVAINALSPGETKEWFQGFAQIRVSPQLASLDWVNGPVEFVEQLSS